jgi:hypothetical protein
MRHLDLLLLRHPELRNVDYQRLVQKVKLDPAAHWAELADASAPIVYTAALGLAQHKGNAESLAEEATRQVFELIAANDFAVVRDYVGYGKWTSELVRLTQLAPVLSDLRRDREFPEIALDRAVEDPDQAIPVLEPRFAQLLDKEGDRFFDAMRKVIGVLHRRDRLMLGLRYEQGLTLRELDQVFRLGTPERVGSLLDRLLGYLQPLRAVGDAWQMPHEQRHALLRVVVHDVYQRTSMGTPADRKIAPAMQGR